MSGGRPRRLCLLLETFHPEIGGGETQARLLVEDLTARGYEILVLTRRSQPDCPRRERLFGATVVRFPPSGRGQLRKWAVLLTIVPGILRIAHRQDAFLVSGFRILGPPAVLAGSLFRRPSILKADSNGELSGDYFRAGLAAAGVSPDNKLVRLLIAMRNAILRRASSFVALSSAMEREFRQEGVRSDKICRIPNGVDTRWFRPPRSSERDAARHELGYSSENFVLTYTGRLVTYKGLPSLLSVWKEARERHPHARLVMVGSGGSDIHNCEDWLKGYVADHGLEASVQFTGSVGDVRPYLWASDGFVFPTEDEAFGISLIEAMACGLPCIATTVGGVIDGDASSEFVIVVQPAHRGQLLDAIDRLLVDANLAARLGRAAARQAMRAYSRDVVAECYDELILGLLVGKEKPVRSTPPTG